MLTLEQKLAHVDEARKRWWKRFTRASNELRKIEIQRRRLEASKGRERPIKATQVPAEVKQMVAEAIGYPPEEPTRPSFLDRSNPMIAEQMTVARKKAEAAERSKMPLSGKAALDYIKKSKKK